MHDTTATNNIRAVQSKRAARHFSRLRNFWTRLILILRETGDAWLADNVPRLSASLAYYSVLSLIPFLVLVASVAGSLFGQKAAQGQLMWEIQDLIGTVGARAIQGLIQPGHKSVTLTVLGFLGLALGTSAVVMELRDALNTIWHRPTGSSFSGFHGLLHVVRERFYLFGLIMIAGLLVVASIAINALVTGLDFEFGPFLPVSPVLMHIVVFCVSFVVVTILFAAIYKVVPEVKLRWNDVMVGASVTSLLFTIGKQIIGVYLGKASFGSTFGAAESLAIILVWVYYSAQLFFFGAEFTRIYAMRVHPRREIGCPEGTQRPPK